MAETPINSEFHCPILRATLKKWIVKSFNLCRFRAFLRKLTIEAVFTSRKYLPPVAGYEPIQQSEVLPALDLEWLTRCLQNPNPLAAAKAFRQGLQE
jgi:hypothetical protein